MLRTRRLALATRTAGVAAALGLALTVTAAPAQAVNDWGNVGELDHARLQACKVSVDGGDAWRVKLRVTNGNDYRVRSRVTVWEGQRETDRTWRSGWVRGGSTSDVGAVRTGTEDAWKLVFSISADQLGGGGHKRVSGIRLC